MRGKRRTKSVVIAERLVSAIREGKYIAGGKLPSIRAAMQRFDVSSKTICKVYRILLDSGFVEKQLGSYMVVAR